MGRRTTSEQVFKRHQKVVAANDMPFVPAGTQGKVLYPAGVHWIRYHVMFENGVIRSSIDARDLVSRDEWKRDRRGKGEPREKREPRNKREPRSKRGQDELTKAGAES